MALVALSVRAVMAKPGGTAAAALKASALTAKPGGAVNAGQIPDKGCSSEAQYQPKVVWIDSLIWALTDRNRIWQFLIKPKLRKNGPAGFR